MGSCVRCGDEFDENRLTPDARKKYRATCGHCIFMQIDVLAARESKRATVTDGDGLLGYVPCNTPNTDGARYEKYGPPRSIGYGHS